VPEPHELYQLAEDLPDLGRPVLIQALTGFVDAGAAGRLAREHLLTTLTGRVIATFDIDALLDYRSRRPVMMFVEDHWESYEEPTLALHVLYDESNTPFLLLAGPEPDLYWDRFTRAVIELIDRLGVRLTVGFNAIPMAVPHTRPTGVTAHATRRELSSGTSPGCAGSRCRARPGTCWSTGSARAAGTPWASPSMCRTTWPRASTRLRPSAC
jgi:predicted ATP-grasp superfamily ATP-dependent carboligase